MGMYDTITVEDDLPMNREMRSLKMGTNNWVLQTKDLECAMNNYVLRNGYLYETLYKINEWVEGDPNAESLFDRLGYMDRKEPYQEKISFTGELRACDYSCDFNDEWDIWCEWKITLVRGKVKGVKLVEFRKTSNKDRRERMQALFDAQQAEQKLWYNRFFLGTPLVRAVRQKIHFGLYRLGTWAHNFSRYF